MAKCLQFLNEVLLEFRKISWPERSQVIRETLSVLFLVALITLLSGYLTWLSENLFLLLLNIGDIFME